MKVEFIDLTISFQPPVECTAKQAEEWISFQLGAIKSMSASNPLVDQDLSDYIKFDADEFLQFKTRYAETN